MSVVPGVRASFLLMAVAIAAVLGYALYTQHVDGLVPCPLCITQRGFYILAGGLALLAALHHPARRGRALYSMLIGLAAIGGAAVAGRQVWLQHLPEDQVPACGPSLEYMLEMFPLSETLQVMFRGDGNCAEVVWQFLGLSMPEWSLLCFLVLLAASIGQALRQPA